MRSTPRRNRGTRASTRSFSKYVCSLVLSRYGNEQKSYRLRKASHVLTPEIEATAADRSTPETNALLVESETEGDRRYEMLLARVAGYPLVKLLLGDDPPDEERSTERARAAGYSLDDIKIARERLKRHIQAVAREFESMRDKTGSER